MSTELDPFGVESRALLRSADFSDARVLEIGSGDGRLAFRYANTSASVIGIEIKPDEVASARGSCPPHLRRRVQFLQATAPRRKN